jgi:hypothetical protein
MRGQNIFGVEKVPETLHTPKMAHDKTINSALGHRIQKLYQKVGVEVGGGGGLNKNVDCNREQVP